MSGTVKIGNFCTIADNVEFGSDVVVYGYANLYGCQIGDGCRIGPFTEIQSNVTLGRRVRVQSHSFICSNVEIGDDVFVGHNVSFINDRFPSAVTARNGTWTCEGIVVGRGASIGTGSVIMCGVEIGEGALIGAGTVVSKSIAPYAVVVGVPGKVIRYLTEEERRRLSGRAEQI